MKMRRLGTIALEMAYLADGRFDALVAGKGEPQQLYDVAAGILLVREAGGRVTDHRGHEYEALATDLVATNGKVHDELIVEAPENEVGRVKALLTESMEGVIELAVPLKIDLSVGRDWRACK